MKNQRWLYVAIGAVILGLLVAAHLFDLAGAIRRIHGG